MLIEVSALLTMIWLVVIFHGIRPALMMARARKGK